MASGLKWVEYPLEILTNRYLAKPILGKKGEVLFDSLTLLEENKLAKIKDNFTSFEIANDLASEVDVAIINSFCKTTKPCVLCAKVRI